MNCPFHISFEDSEYASKFFLMLIKSINAFANKIEDYGEYCSPGSVKVPCEFLRFSQSDGIADVVGKLRTLVDHVIGGCVDGFGHQWTQTMDALVISLGVHVPDFIIPEIPVYTTTTATSTSPKPTRTTTSPSASTPNPIQPSPTPPTTSVIEPTVAPSVSHFFTFSFILRSTCKTYVLVIKTVDYSDIEFRKTPRQLSSSQLPLGKLQLLQKQQQNQVGKQQKKQQQQKGPQTQQLLRQQFILQHQAQQQPQPQQRLHQEQRRRLNTLKK